MYHEVDIMTEVTMEYPTSTLYFVVPNLCTIINLLHHICAIISNTPPECCAHHDASHAVLSVCAQTHVDKCEYTW